jgi:hypothetical protein
VQILAERGLGEINKILARGSEEPGRLEKILVGTSARKIDWDVVMRLGNAWYDRLAAARRQPTWATRSAALGAIANQWGDLPHGSGDFLLEMQWVLSGPADAASERMGEMLVAHLLPVLESFRHPDARAAANAELLKLAALLAAYRANHGSFPAQLSELIPDYVAQLPLDFFSGEPPVYKPQANGYILYSVGVNGRDDGGLGYEDRGPTIRPDQDYDDVVIRVLKP